MQAAQHPSAPQEHSILFYMEPKNDSAIAVMKNNPRRTVEWKTAAGVRIKVLYIHLNEPNQRRGLVVFGRHPNCGVKFKDPKVAAEHCFVDMNPSSGELLVCDTSRCRSTLLDNEIVCNPSSRAMVYRYSRYLKIGSAIFEIHWPSIPDKKLREYSEMKVAAARRLREDPERLFDLTDVEWDLYSVPPTADCTHDSTRPATPAPGQRRRKKPIKISQLGQGSFGIVYKAVDRNTADFLAVKEFNGNIYDKNDVISKQQVMATFVREITMMKNLDHKNVIRLFEWQEFEGKIHLELEYCSAGNLGNHNRHAINVTDMFRQIAEGLHYLHVDCNIIHRDVKPENILVHDCSGKRSFKLGDFGISNLIAEAHTVCGTPQYMAPELCLRKSQTTGIDIYALGVVILEGLGVLTDLFFMHEAGPRGFCDLVIERASDHISEAPVFRFSRHMIMVSPHMRPTAAQCVDFCKCKRLPQESALVETSTTEPQRSIENNHHKQGLLLGKQHSPKSVKMTTWVERQEPVPNSHELFQKQEEHAAPNKPPELQRASNVDRFLKYQQQSVPSDQNPRQNRRVNKKRQKDKVAELQNLPQAREGAARVKHTRKEKKHLLERRLAARRLRTPAVPYVAAANKGKAPLYVGPRPSLAGD